MERGVDYGSAWPRQQVVVGQLLGLDAVGARGGSAAHEEGGDACCLGGGAGV